jgi:(p)ppGpp synthase/HD superfamily hydrolase
MKNITLHATEFAAKAHEGQFRNYTGVPYIWHPISVAVLMSKYTDDPELLAVAMLHDTLEDTDATYTDLLLKFGKRVADLVYELTNRSNRVDTPLRKDRRAEDAAQMAVASNDAQFVRLFDMAHNLGDISNAPQKFATLYMSEKRLMLDALTKAKRSCPDAWNMVDKIISEFQNK